MNSKSVFRLLVLGTAVYFGVGMLNGRTAPDETGRWVRLKGGG